MSENDLLLQIIYLAHFYNWRVVHFRPAMTANGWRTPAQGDGAGWPDLIFLKGKRVVVAKLKADGKRPTLEQYEWLEAWHKTGTETFIWTPKMWPEIQEVLTW